MYMNNNFYDEAGTKEQNLDIVKEMTEGMVVLNNMTTKFKPDKSGKKWFEYVM